MVHLRRPRTAAFALTLFLALLAPEPAVWAHGKKNSAQAQVNVAATLAGDSGRRSAELNTLPLPGDSVVGTSRSLQLWPGSVVGGLSLGRPRRSQVSGVGVSQPLPALGIASHLMWASATTYPEEFPLYSAMGATWVRTDVSWAGLQPSGPGSYDDRYLNALDARVEKAASDHLRVLLVLVTTPAWARPIGGTEFSPPSPPSAYGNVEAFLAARYQRYGVALEVWNEPNLPTSFVGANALAYTQLACATFKAVKTASPKTTVVVGALSSFDRSFLRDMFSYGISDCMDALSIHPYVSPPTPHSPQGWVPSASTWFTAGMGFVQSLLAEYEVRLMPVWFTEFGWSADPARSGPVLPGMVSPKEQANYTVNFLNFVGTRYPDVAVAVLYEGKDTEQASTPQERHYGLFTSALQPKPVVAAVASLYG